MAQRPTFTSRRNAAALNECALWRAVNPSVAKLEGQYFKTLDSQEGFLSSQCPDSRLVSNELVDIPRAAMVNAHGEQN